MNHSLYVGSVAVHILAAVTWLGGMMFLVFILMPALRGLEDVRLRSQLVRATGIRFRVVGWACLVVLLITGYLNLAARGIGGDVLLSPEFWTSTYGRTLFWKLLLFMMVLSISATHDFFIGPAAGHVQQRNPGSPEALRLRRMAIWFGRLNMFLTLVIVLLGVMLVRGVPW